MVLCSAEAFPSVVVEANVPLKLKTNAVGKRVVTLQAPRVLVLLPRQNLLLSAREISTCRRHRHAKRLLGEFSVGNPYEISIRRSSSCSGSDFPRTYMTLISGESQDLVEGQYSTCSTTCHARYWSVRAETCCCRLLMILSALCSLYSKLELLRSWHGQGVATTNVHSFGRQEKEIIFIVAALNTELLF